MSQTQQQVSPDGYWAWDGNQWQSTSQPPPAPTGPTQNGDTFTSRMVATGRGTGTGRGSVLETSRTVASAAWVFGFVLAALGLVGAIIAGVNTAGSYSDFNFLGFLYVALFVAVVSFIVLLSSRAVALLAVIAEARK